ncbi:MAG TPA: aconitate hydratase [Planctomycetes bacterium]|nr:aconitate hydratase [Planctomycetota bacterium]
MESPLAIARSLYSRQAALHQKARQALGRPLTLAEKILFAHRADPEGELPVRGKSMGSLHPDRVAMQDATAQMAILQFISAGLPKVALPTTVHCDHLIRARDGEKEDLARAQTENGEVYRFLESAAQKYGMGFWKPGAGIIHQVVLENYAFPGGLMIGTDSHTPNAGGLGMVAVGVGGADAVDAMVGMPWEVLWPKLIGVRLTGKLGDWAAPKEVILKMLDLLTCAGGTGKIVEYFGPGAESFSCTGKATVTNMGAELGATTSLFHFDESMLAYLRSTEREELATLCEEHRDELRADPEVYENPEKFYDEFIEIDLSTLEPSLVGPHTPDLHHPMSRMGADAKENDYPVQLSSALIGSCTNSSYEDLGKAAHIARQAKAAGLKAKVPFFITPGSEQVEKTTERDGQLSALKEIGGIILADACGPCIGQWERTDIEKGTKNSIVTSFNRNFPARNDGNPETLAFIGSPELVTALAISGRLDFDPRTDRLETPSGGQIKLETPVADELPPRGFDTDVQGYLPPAEDGSGVQVEIAEGSERLSFLEPFAPPKIPEDFVELAVLLKAKGKCTTDHISPAGPWLRYRGHLDKISDNMFLGANNSFTDRPGTALNRFTGEVDLASKVARDYKARGEGWVVFGDWNYGEGSSREHAAMEPRWLGGRAVIVRSFARIHETNLKKQGVLPLTFKNPEDYDKVQAKDLVTLEGLESLAPHSEVTIVLRHEDGSTERFATGHSMTSEQIAWFHAGSALNLIKQKQS